MATLPSTLLTNPCQSFWTQASAGSGKTKNLIDRIACLLVSGFDPSSIVCLTFTNAASREMNERLFALMIHWKETSQDILIPQLSELLGTIPTPYHLNRARQLFDLLTQSSYGVKLQTIHQFCLQLLQQFPMESDLAPGFSLLDKTQQDGLMDNALDQIIQQSLQCDHLDYLQNHLSYHRIKELLVQIRQDHVILDPSHYSEQLAVELGLVNDIFAINPTSFSSNPFSLSPLVAKDLPDLFNALDCSTQDKERILGQLLRKNPLDLDIFNQWINALLTKDLTPRKKIVSAKWLGNYPKAAMILKDICRDLVNHLDEQKKRAYFALNHHWYHFAFAVIKGYTQQKHDLNVVDFDDVIHKAIKLLKQPAMISWIFSQLGYAIEHLLIDEAQDTNPHQWVIIDLLVEELFHHHCKQTLFIVGDAKQSIYSFHGANARAYDAIRYALTEKTQAYDAFLTKSYRTLPAILSVTDTLFEKRTLLGTAAYQPHIAHRQHHPGGVALIQLDECMGEDNKGTLQERAALIVKKVWNLLESRLNLPSRGRFLEPQDIMILFRNRKPWMAALRDAFKDQGIKVATKDLIDMKDNLAVLDLLAFLRFLHRPQDDYNLACVLKSPLIISQHTRGKGVEEDQLLHLCRQRFDAEKKPSSSSLWEELNQSHDPYFMEVTKVLHHFLIQAELVSPTFLLTRLIEENQQAFWPYWEEVEGFMSICYRFTQEESGLLTALISHLESADLLLPPFDQHNAVQLMTVHGSKGLQAPVVVIVDQGSYPKPQDDDWFSYHGLWMLRPLVHQRFHWIEAVQNERVEEQIAEHHRLLYVAMTRAQDFLIVVGLDEDPKPQSWSGVLKEVKKDLPGESKNDGWFYPYVFFIDEADEEDKKTTKKIVLKEILSIDPVLKEEALHKSSLHEWQEFLMKKGSIHEQKNDAVEHKNEKELNPILTPLSTAARDRGIALHRQLEGYNLMSKIAGDHPLDMDPDLAQVFAKLGSSPIFTAPGINEVEFVFKGKRGRIDRLVFLQETHLPTQREIWIIDYKTGKRPKIIPEAYQHQLSFYQCAIAEMYPSWEVRSFLLWVEDGELSEL